ncbi:MAG: Flp pilus assembly protein CpaB [Pseudomonadota bacterium]
MNAARIIVLAIAVGAGGLAAILAGSRSEPEPVIVADETSNDTTEILVADGDISMGRQLSTADVRWQAWPSDLVDGRYLTRTGSGGNMDDVVGSIARQPFIAGEPINTVKLVQSDRGFMSAILPKGMRAISTEISPETGAGGFILPNDRVDVILTKRDTAAEDAGAADPFLSETILTNVRVLAIDQTVEDQDGEKVVVGRTATLELQPEQAEVLALAEQLGELALALRSLEDSSPDDGGPQIAGGNSQGRVIMMKFGRSQQVSTQ